MTDVVDAAHRWLAADPDERTRAELERTLRRAAEGDEDARAELADAFSGPLEFGTAGLRGRMGPGPRRMNSVVVAQAAAGLGRYLLEHGHCTSCEGLTVNGVTIIPPVSIPPGTVIESAVVGPHVTLGEGCVIKNVVVRDSIIEAGTHIKDMVINGSLIGRNVILEGKPDRLNIGDNSWVTK